MSKYEDDFEGDDLIEDGEIKSRSVKSNPKKVQQNDISDMSDTQDSLEIRPPQATLRTNTKERIMKRSRPERIRYDEERMERRQRKDSHRKSHHRQREHHRGERVREKRHHRERREGKERERERGRGDRREHERGGRMDGGVPPALMSLPTPQIDDLRNHLDRREKGERRSEGSKEHHRERREKHSEEMRKPPSETPQQREERLEKERRMERLLNAEREREKQKEMSRREIEIRKTRREQEPGERERSRSPDRKKHRNGDGPEEDTKEHEEIIVSETEEEESQEEGEDNDQSQEESSDDEGENGEGQSSGESESGSGSSSDSESTESDEDSDAKVEDEKEDNKQLVAEKSVNMEEDSDKDEDDDLALDKTPPKSDVEMVEEEEDPLDLLPAYLPAIQGCRNVEEFQCLNRIEEGTYGVVYRARDKRTDEIVALKRLKMEKEKEGFPITSLREINTLLKAQHPNIVTVREIVVGSNMDKIFIVMDYVEHDLKSLMETMKQKKQVFLPGEIKCLMDQLLKAVAHLHDNWILHRDLKTSNLLLSHRGILKVGDFGLAREYGSPLKAYTPIVVTLWYRAPELLLGIKEYSHPIDVWSVGCIFGELLLMEALFPGKSELDQLNKIFRALGTPNEKIWPGYQKLPNVKKMTFAEYPVSHLRTKFATKLSEKGFDLMNSFLTFDPAKRITAETALKHEYFDETPCAIDPAMFPTWPAKSELGHKKAPASPKPPSGGREYKQLGDGEEELSAAGRGLFEVRKSVVGAGFNLRF